MANSKATKSKTPVVDVVQGENVNDGMQNVTPSSTKPKNAKASPKAKTKKTSPKPVNDTPAEENSVVPEGDAGADVDVKPKISVVPMPLVKKVKEQLVGIQLKNVNELKNILDTFINVIMETTMNGTSVTLPNCVTFKRSYRNTRDHKNPKTREVITKPEHFVLTMCVKDQLKKKFESIPVIDRPVNKKNIQSVTETTEVKE